MKRNTLLFLVRYRSLEQKWLAGLNAHYEVLIAETRREALAFLTTHPVDLVLADVPSIRFDLARFWEEARARNPEVRLFLLLDKGTRLDQVPRAHGYLRYVFSSAQLLRCLARVLPADQGEVVTWRGLHLDVEGHFLIWETRQVALRPKQTALMRAFLWAPDQIVSRAQLMRDVWGTDFLGDTRTLDVHIHWLRKSLERLQAPFALETERGNGYRLTTRLPAPSAEDGNLFAE
ncbi:MAG TPA: winged helix-turn-helix domain-containing protein [Anaerolineae bacterium]|nr:winged helix-turn-helix domain-containing protein [Anaerolineae bacterium]